MPKPIKVLLEVEEIALGPLMNRLHNMEGVISFAPILGDTKANGAAHKPRTRYETSNRKFVLKVLAEKKRLGPKELQAVFTEAGRRPTNYSSALWELKRDGLAKQNPDGTYGLTKKGHDRARHV